MTILRFTSDLHADVSVLQLHESSPWRSDSKSAVKSPDVIIKSKLDVWRDSPQQKAEQPHVYVLVVM